MSHRIYSLQRIQTWDDAWCLRFNRASINPAMRRIFRLISRLGDGIFWYCLMLWLLAEYQVAALLPVLHMAAAGLVCTVLYKWLKHKTHRARPYNRNRASTAASHRWTNSASLPDTRCMPWPSASWHCPTIRRSPGCCCRSPHWWPFRVWCSGCTTPAMCWPES